MGCGHISCVPRFAGELWHFEYFPTATVRQRLIFDHRTVTVVRICCCIRNFIKIGSRVRPPDVLNCWMYNASYSFNAFFPTLRWWLTWMWYLSVPTNSETHSGWMILKIYKINTLLLLPLKIYLIILKHIKSLILSKKLAFISTFNVFILMFVIWFFYNSLIALILQS